MGLTFRYLWVLAGSMYLAFCRSATFLCGLLSSKPSCTTVSTRRSPFSTDLHLGKVFFCSLFPFLQGILGFKKVPSKSLAMTASWRPFGGRRLHFPRRPKRNGIQASRVVGNMWLHILAFAPSGHFITCNACLWEDSLLLGFTNKMLLLLTSKQVNVAKKP